ncbi:uncharacterized protein LOC114537483 [Dendronephthya gigantea]|uniref:uncharacterized protein LOC114537483 n=1 Tax=Dendronephthya gigantea TaxID=151771 RepID=UPI00106B0AC3|nr:uncharacterized protein LOC114537483 [Dendronephthya gigantea]XP_028414331.1 uncharacterized protein LOC114537483 [Dendronephthya gigantea]
MSQMSSASEPPILAKQVGVLDDLKETEAIQPHKQKSQEALVKRVKRNVLSTTTISETSDHSSSLLWTPAQPAGKQANEKPASNRSHRKRDKSGGKRRLYKDEKTTESEETSQFLSKQEQEHERLKSEKMYSFDRDYHHHRTSRRSRSSSGRQSSRRSNKKHLELTNDYTRYQYHRRSQRDKHRKHNSRSQQKNDTEASTTSGLPKLIKRLKVFFFGKRSDHDEHDNRTAKEHGRDFHQHSNSKKHKHDVSAKLFRSASDSDLEVVKHRNRRSLHKKGVKDDFLKENKHWKSRHHDHKLTSICESSDRSGKLGSGSDAGKLVLARSGRTTYNDITGHKNGDLRRANGHCKKDERDTSEGSHSHIESSHSRRRHKRRNKEYQSLKKKWAKQHQSFENDLEKLEKLVELIGMKKTQGWLEQKSSENTTLLERLEATQEKCVAEVDFTRHVLICKLQRLENKLEESLSTIDYNNNNTLTDEKGRSIDEIRDEMSKEYHDLRKLLQETSTQLKQVLDDKPSSGETAEQENNDDQRLKGIPTPVEKRSGGHSQTRNGVLKATNIPFPELSHHPLNTRHSRNLETEPGHSKNYETEPGCSRNYETEAIRKDNVKTKQQEHSRVTTYV